MYHLMNQKKKKAKTSESSDKRGKRKYTEEEKRLSLDEVKNARAAGVPQPYKTAATKHNVNIFTLKKWDQNEKKDAQASSQSQPTEQPLFLPPQAVEQILCQGPALEVALNISPSIKTEPEDENLIEITLTQEQEIKIELKPDESLLEMGEQEHHQVAEEPLEEQILLDQLFEAEDSSSTSTTSEDGSSSTSQDSETSEDGSDTFVPDDIYDIMNVL